jgi:hypothetical protein
LKNKTKRLGFVQAALFYNIPKVKKKKAKMPIRKIDPQISEAIAKLCFSYLYSLYLTNSTIQHSPADAIRNAGPVRQRKITKFAV